MNEIIVRLARTLACEERLRVLTKLATEEEQSPSELARNLDITLSVLSEHLAKLSSSGLIQRRHSGVWSYCVAASPYAKSTLSGMTQRWLKELLASPSAALKTCGLGEVRNSSDAAATEQLHRIIFHAATAFTDLRRLQILRHLKSEGHATMESLSRDLKMSLWAVRRHTDKLERRGYISAQKVAGESTYRLTTSFKSPVHQQLWTIVSKSLEGKP
jgi:DNA-binding transcriptional ArsR family regulator